MKKLLLVTLLLGSLAQAQSSHSVTISWSPSSDAIGNPSGNYNILRASTPCTAVPLNLVKIGTALAQATSFNDSAVPLGSYCYAVTFVANGVESVDSNTTAAVVLPSPPTSVTATVH